MRLCYRGPGPPNAHMPTLPTSRPVIQVAGVRKTYGSTVAVDEVSFQVNEGEIFGLIGPDGAGKTTTMECIEGLRTPTAASSPFWVSIPSVSLQAAGSYRRAAPTSATPEANQSLGGRRPLGFALRKKRP